VLAQDVRPGQGVVRTERRVLDEDGRGVEGGRHAEDGGQLLVLDLDEARGFLGRVLRLGRHRGHGLAVVLRLTHGDDRAVGELGPEARDRLGEVRRGHDQADAGHLLGGARIYGDDPGMRAVKRDELDLEHVLEPDVGHVLLAAGDPADAADAVG